MSFLVFLDEVTKQLKDSGATFMYTIETFVATAQEAARKYGKIKVCATSRCTFFYRPQGKVMFSEAFVCPPGGEGGSWSDPPWILSRGSAQPPWRQTPGGRLPPQVVTFSGDHYSGRCASY